MSKRMPRGTSAWSQPVTGTTAFERTKQAFGSELASVQYPAGYRQDIKGYFECRAVLKMISKFPSDGHILDCPCGTGRVTQLLLARGLRVSAADCSPHMVDRCRKNMLSRFPHFADRMFFCVEDIAATTFAVRSFDGVICNRLFHHYDDVSTRIVVLRELSRISRGLVVVSYSNSFSASKVRNRLRHVLAGRRRAPLHSVSTAQMASEFEAAGMEVVLSQPVLRGLSRMWYMCGRTRSLAASS